MNISLGTYTVRLYDSKENQDIDLENNNYSISISQVIKDYFTISAKIKKKDEKEKKIIFIENFNSKGNYIDGIIKSGEYGYSSEIIDTENNEISYNKNKNEAEVLPFYFKLFLERHRLNQYYLIIQRIGVHGVKTPVEKDLNRYLRLRYSEHKNLRIKIHDLTSEKAINYYLENGSVNELKFIRYKIRKDIIDQFDEGAKEENGKMELIIKETNMPIGKKLKKFFSGSSKDTKNFISIPGFDYSDVKVQFSLNGKSRTLSFNNSNKFKAYYDISEDIKIGDNGHPLIEDLKESVDGLYDDIIKTLEASDEK